MVALSLTSCSSKYKVKVDLTPEEVSATKAEIVDLKEKIKNFKGEPGEIPGLQIIALAKAYEKMGDLKTPINIYKDWLGREGVRAKSFLNNLGRLYEQVGEVELAVGLYQKLIDDYMDSDYLYDITWAYIRAAQNATGKQAVEYRKLAEKYFNAWQLDKQRTDDQTQQEIKKLRDLEVQPKN